MKTSILLLWAMLVVLGVKGQNLHNQANAASILNEANTTAGWIGNAAITSSSVNPFQGGFALSATSTGVTGSTRDMNYSFNAVVGQVYNISIWAREGNLSFNPAFANWSGFTGFSTTVITGATWTEYTWSLTASSTTPIIRVYTAPYSGGQVGSQVLIDNISITTPDTTPPTIPTNLLASGTTQATTMLNWTASTDNVGVTGYTVFQDGAQIGTTDGATTTLNVTGLTAATTYSFTVTANDAVPNTSAASTALDVTTLSVPDTEAPSIPLNLVAANLSQTAFDLSWDNSTDNVGVTGYTVFQDATQIGTTDGATTTFNVTGLTAATTYSFTVTANDAVPNTSAASTALDVTTLSVPDTEAPSIPLNLVAANLSQTAFDLSWDNSTDNVGVTGYTVFQDATQIGTTDGATTTFNVTGLTAATTYSFTVTANDAVPNTSAASTALDVTTDIAILHYTEENANLSTVDWQARDLTASQNIFVANGNIGIGTINTQGYRLAVDGNIIAEEIKVELSQNWPDFVFTKSYGLPTLEEVEKHILQKGHLQNIPNAKEVELNGIKLGEMNAKLLQKIEELTLYTIQQEKKIIKLEAENQKIQLLSDKLLELEKLIKNL
jgi:chitodextrinase